MSISPTTAPLWVESRDLPGTLAKVRPYTMIANDTLTDLARLVQTAFELDIPGNFVECGVWRGGAAFLMADLARQAGAANRKVWLCDSPEGLPPPQAIDGAGAVNYVTHTDSPYYYENCRASLGEVQSAAQALGLAEHTEFLAGWFDQTLPAARERIGPIAVLRLDCDWYASVKCCLENLFDLVVDGGFIFLDDYFYVEGCAAAVHEFLGARRLGHRIESFSGGLSGIDTISGHWTGCEEYADIFQGAVIRKGGDRTWKEQRDLHLIAQDIASRVPAGETFILADYGMLTDELLARWRVLPVAGNRTSRPTDKAAIDSIERQGRQGAAFLAFAWSAFWWIDHDSALGRYVRSRFGAVLENERVVVFDLRAQC